MKKLDLKQSEPEMSGVFKGAGGRRARSGEDRLREAAGALDVDLPAERYVSTGDSCYRRRHLGGAE